MNFFRARRARWTLLWILAPLLAHGDETAPPRFAWPEGARANVVERATKDAMTIEFHYTITLSRRVDHDGLELRYSNYDVARVNDQDANTPEMRRELAAALPLFSLYPAIYVSERGEFEGTGDYTAMMKQALAYVGSHAAKPLDAKEQAEMEKMMSSPQMRNAINQKYGDAWRIWVENWIGEIPGPGEKLEFTMQVPIGDQLVEAPLTKQRLDDGADRRVLHLRSESTLEGPKAVAAMRAFTKRLIEQFDKSKAKAADIDQISGFRRVVRMEAEIDAITLQPRTASDEQTITMTADGKSQTKREVHAYEFDWQSAPAAGDPPAH